MARPVLFEVNGNWEGPGSEQRLFRALLLFTFGVWMLVAVWRNWRSGRIDRRGASRLSAVVFVLSIVAGQGFLSFSAVAITWVLYAGIEPYARRYWPDSLISWTRFSQGRMRNPLVASHILAAILFSAAFSYLYFPAMMSLVSTYPRALSVEAGLSDAGSLRFFVERSNGGNLSALQYLTILVLGRIALRKRWAADLGLCLLSTR